MVKDPSKWDICNCPKKEGKQKQPKETTQQNKQNKEKNTSKKH